LQEIAGSWLSPSWKTILENAGTDPGGLLGSQRLTIVDRLSAQHQRPAPAVPTSTPLTAGNTAAGSPPPMNPPG